MHSLPSTTLGLAALVCSLCAAVIGPAGEASSAPRSADRHVHGTASLTLVQEGDALIAHLESPVYNFAGFERPPETPAQQQTWGAIIEVLKTRADQLIRPNRAARCSLVEAALEDPFAADHDGESHVGADSDERHLDHYEADGDAPAKGSTGPTTHTAPGAQGAHGAEAAVHDATGGEAVSAPSHEHTDLHVEYRFECARIEQLREVDVGLFDDFPGLARLEAVYLGRRQSGATLSPSGSRFRWK